MSQETPPTLLTLSQFAERHPAFPVSTLRWLRWCSRPRCRAGRAGRMHVVDELSPNGFAPAFLKVGGRVLVDEARFFEILRSQNEETT